jgi:hypothetical protein
VTYLGVSGLLISHRGRVLLTDPFFSNPPLGTVRPKVRRLLRRSPRLVPDTNAIERLLPRSADIASAILIGHGHYDHLLDVPYIATHRAAHALVYGSTTVRHMLMGDPVLRENNGRRLIAISQDIAATAAQSGTWIYTTDSAFRFMPIRGGHAPTFRWLKESYTFAAGGLAADMETLPQSAPEWKLGEPYAFLIDVLEPGSTRTVFRIFFQDAPSAPPDGFPPSQLLAEHRVDLAVICAATSSNVPQTPDSLLKFLDPTQVLVTHWESFFRSQSLEPEVVRGLHLEAFVASIRRSLNPSVAWTIALPGVRTVFPTG